MRITPITITGTPHFPYVYGENSISLDDWEKKRRANKLKFISKKDDVSFFMSENYERFLIIPEYHPFFNFTTIIYALITDDFSYNDSIRDEIKDLLIDKYVKVLYL